MQSSTTKENVSRYFIHVSKAIEAMSFIFIFVFFFVVCHSEIYPSIRKFAMNSQNDLENMDDVIEFDEFSIR